MDKVFVAVFNKDTGYIKQITQCFEGEADKQHLAHDNHNFVIVPAGTSPRLHMIDLKTLKVIDRIVLPAEIKREQTFKAHIEVVQGITGGFISSALGEDHLYPSNSTDQANMLQAALVGGHLMTCKNDVWELKDHTPEQAREVLAAFVSFKDSHRLRLRGNLDNPGKA